MRLALGVLLGAAAGVIATTRRPPSGHRPPQPGHRGDQGKGAPPHRHSDQDAAAGDAHGEAAPEQPAIQAQRIASPDTLAGDEEHKRKERDYWQSSLRISKYATAISLGAFLFAAAAFIATWRAMEASQEQARTAQSALIAADRPWIKVLNLSKPRVQIEGLGVFLRAELAVRNTGRSPAQHTFVRAKLLPDGSAVDEANEAEALYREAAARGVPFTENLIFPDDEPSIAVHALADTRDIAKHWRDRIERDFRTSRPFFGDELAENTRAERLSYPVRAGLTLIGCVTYVIPTGRTYGQTAFIYGFNRNCGLGPYGMCSFEMEEPGTYEGDALVVREAIGGAFAR